METQAGEQRESLREDKMQEQASKVRLILSDVDGVMTDGKIIYNADGIESKVFSVRDGFGIRLWIESGGLFGIVTGRSSNVVRMRSDELGVHILRQGIKDKAEALRQIVSALGVSLEETAFIGDDYPDLPAMQIAGFPATVADAAEEIRASSVWVSEFAGGAGAVRQLIETILKARNQWNSAIQFYRAGTP